MVEMNPSVDGFLRKNRAWQGELTKLRQILLDCGLTEEMKWRAPCYTFEGSNVAIIHGFKRYCGLSFFKGALLTDPKGFLTKPGENTQAGRVMRFTGVDEIAILEGVIKSYVHEAKEVETAGLRVDFKAKTELVYPEELQKKLDVTPLLKKAFMALTPGRQRSYVMHIAGAKQGKTREARVEKCVGKIMEGKGFNEY